VNVPFVDLDAQYLSIKQEVLSAIEGVLESKQFIQGKLSEEFVQDFIKVHGGNYGVGCSNGTSAITVSLRALGIGPGDEVITVANTFFATIEAIAEVGATPVLIDCDRETYSMDVEKVANAISKKTKAIIPVHLYGNPAKMDNISEIAKRHNLNIIEDCAQAHLSTYKNQAVGTFGDAGTFSFYPGKNLGAYGDAGLVLAKNKELNDLISMHVNHGRTKKYEHDFLAGNYRMDGIQAAILSIKSKYIESWTNQRIEAAAFYDSKLEHSGLKVIKKQEQGKCVYHLYVVEVSNRNEVMNYLKENNISCGIHYPVPMHLQPACKHLGYEKGDFPVSEMSSDRIVSIPIFPEISNEQQEFVVNKLLDVARN
jgi:dTDP-4-amino-4,6-dideoxygalactose transaminase